jgi:ribosomal protein S18 acetylase RimI-like enzyme
VRGATAGDAPDLARLASRPATEMADRIAVGHGQDHFLVVAVDTTNHELLGFSAAGGARGQQAKGNGEIYDCHVETRHRRRHVARALIEHVLVELAEARYGAVTCTIEKSNLAGVALASSMGFRLVEDGPIGGLWRHELP